MSLARHETGLLSEEQHYLRAVRRRARVWGLLFGLLAFVLAAAALLASSAHHYERPGSGCDGLFVGDCVDGPAGHQFRWAEVAVTPALWAGVAAAVTAALITIRVRTAAGRRTAGTIRAAWERSAADARGHATRDVRVCVVGDSFVAGVGDPVRLGWAGRLAAWGEERHGGQLTLYNLGVRRQTSRDVRDRWYRECAGRLPEGCEARVVFSFGVNDTTVENGAVRVAPEESAGHLAAMLEKARSWGWQTLVVGPPPVAEEAQNARIRELDARFARVCAVAGVGYVSVVGRLREDVVWMAQVRAGDGAHPAADGYEAFARLVRPQWDRWLGSA